MNSSRLTFRRGLRDGLPICLGYLSVSFTFGIATRSGGLPLWAAQLFSMSNLTSAGQFAGLEILLKGGLLTELFVATLVINLRYFLMSLSLAQRLPASISGVQRAFLAFFNTDEIYAVAMTQTSPLTFSYFCGLGLLPYLGWSFGTLLGATLFEALPASLLSALGIAIYGMFLSILLPPMTRSRAVLLTALISAGLSCLLSFLPFTASLSPGWRIILCTLAAASFAARRFPVREEEGHE